MERSLLRTEPPPHLRRSWALIGISGVKLIPLCDTRRSVSKPAAQCIAETDESGVYAARHRDPGRKPAEGGVRPVGAVPTPQVVQRRFRVRWLGGPSGQWPCRCSTSRKSERHLSALATFGLSCQIQASSSGSITITTKYSHTSVSASAIRITIFDTPGLPSHALSSITTARR